ncbi:ABC transporter substrate-binding protein [Haloarcula salina]|uniref:ABC transporter substrate-binding protein n=1 Tax=Haloarcula salina TaxID=1429914 RepID=UPI003C6F6182
MVSQRTTPTEGTADRADVELLHQFSGPDQIAVDALVDGFERERGVSVTEATTPKVSLEVKRRLLRERPPDLWMDWPGNTLRPYQRAGVISDVTELWEASDMHEKYHEGAKTASRLDGRYYAVPINIHRLNNLFYNVDVLDRAGIRPEEIDTPRELLDALETVENATGAVGVLFPFKNQWTSYVLQLWEQVLLGQSGVDTHRSICRSDPEAHRNAIRDAIGIVRDIADYAPDDAVYLSWEEAERRFVDGESAFFPQGDWSASVFHDAPDFAFGTDWDHVPFPGTDGQYVLNMDAIVPAADAANPAAARAFLEYAGSIDGQRRFNREKGSIPPRTDVPVDQFPPFLRSQMAAFTADETEPVQSISHGQAIGPATLVELQGAFSTFLLDWNPDDLYDRLVDIL